MLKQTVIHTNTRNTATKKYKKKNQNTNFHTFLRCYKRIQKNYTLETNDDTTENKDLRFALEGGHFLMCRNFFYETITRLYKKIPSKHLYIALRNFSVSML